MCLIWFNVCCYFFVGQEKELKKLRKKVKEIQCLMRKGTALPEEERKKVAKLASFQEAIVALEDAIKEPVGDALIMSLFL